MKEARLRHYRNNKDAYILLKNKKKKEMIEYVKTIKEKTPCTDCGLNYPYYVIQDDKIATINILARSGSWKKLLKEIEKCEVVCANCHAIRTYQRKFM